MKIVKFEEQEIELIMFSGGIDSVYLCQELLKKGKKLLALSLDLSYDIGSQPRSVLQKLSVQKTSGFFLKNNFKNFEIIDAGIFFNVNRFDFPQHKWFGSFDENWALFMAGIVANLYGINNIWKGEFTYNFMERIQINGGSYAEIDKSTTYSSYPYIKWAFKEDPSWMNVSVKAPFNVYKNKDMDRFLTRKEAFNALDPYLQKYVRSCIGREWFCGECAKCNMWKHAGISNEIPEETLNDSR
tara:strand:- start:545 stop:1270 length:726 start_codon:yes stop_codon:yes gene_type:complete